MRAIRWKLIIEVLSVFCVIGDNMYTTAEEQTTAEDTSSEAELVAILDRSTYIGIQEQIKQLSFKIDNEFKILNNEFLNMKVAIQETKLEFHDIKKNILKELKEDIQESQEEQKANIFESIKQFNNELRNDILNLKEVLKQDVKLELQEITKNILESQQALNVTIFESNKQNMKQVNGEIESVLLNLNLVSKQDMKLVQQDIKKILLEDVKENTEQTTNISETLHHIQDLVTRPTSCAQALDPDYRSGVYQLFEYKNGFRPFSAYCLQDPHDNGSAWTVIQRRQDGSVDFYRDWQAYERGFGNIGGEFWLGLDKIHAITQSQQYELWVQLEKFGGEKAYAKYDKFAIGNADNKYALMLGKYYGNASDTLLFYHNTMKFTTKDKDNDLKSDGNCAKLYNGAWWYNNCFASNLNGKYYSTGASPHLQGIQWNPFTDPKRSLKYVHMAIRPVT